MASRAELLELAESVERATGSDRELDAAIALALGWKREMFGGAGLVWRDPAGRFPIAAQPEYSRSLDAAMTLVPEGWWLSRITRDAVDGGYGAVVSRNKREASFSFNPKSPALALCAAALRAIASKDSPNGA